MDYRLAAAATSYAPNPQAATPIQLGGVLEALRRGRAAVAQCATLKGASADIACGQVTQTASTSDFDRQRAPYCIAAKAASMGGADTADCS